MNDEIIIRKWNEGDVNEVRNVLQLSWREAYSSFIPQKDLDLYLDRTYSAASLREIACNKNIICYVAETESKIIGWLKLTASKEENRFYLSSMYVSPDYQKMKIGEKFFKIACDEARRKGSPEIFIGVMVKNERALNWYKKLGFSFLEEQPFTMGYTTIPHLIGKKSL